MSRHALIEKVAALLYMLAFVPTRWDKVFRALFSFGSCQKQGGNGIWNGFSYMFDSHALKTRCASAFDFHPLFS